MARFLLLALDIAHNGRQEGDPVGVFDDSHVFGEREDKSVWLANGNAAADWPGTFYVVDIAGMSRSVAERIYQVWRRRAVLGDPEFNAPDEVDRYVVLGRHRWQLGVADKLPGNLRQKLRRDGVVDVPFNVSVLNGYITDRNGLDVFITDTPIDP